MKVELSDGNFGGSAYAPNPKHARLAEFAINLSSNRQTFSNRLKFSMSKPAATSATATGYFCIFVIINVGRNDLISTKHVFALNTLHIWSAYV